MCAHHGAPPWPAVAATTPVRVQLEGVRAEKFWDSGKPKRDASSGVFRVMPFEESFSSPVQAHQVRKFVYAIYETEPFK
jgi:hypothetical protein